MVECFSYRFHRGRRYYLGQFYSFQDCKISINHHEDTIQCTKNPKGGKYKLNIGYEIIGEEEDHSEMKWWHSTIWKLEFPLKNIMFLWLNLAGKISVWDHLSRFMGIGPRICSLCHTAKDSIHHIFINFPYFVEMWNYFFVF